MVWGLPVECASQDMDEILPGASQTAKSGRETIAASRLSICTGSRISGSFFQVVCGSSMAHKGSLPLPSKLYLQSSKHPFRLEQLLTSTEFGWVQAEDFKAESNIISKFMRNLFSPKCTNVLPEKWRLLPES